MGIIHDHGQMVAGPDVLSPHHHVSQRFRLGRNQPRVGVVPGQGTGLGHTGRDIEPKREFRPGIDPIIPLGGRKLATGSRINGAFGAVRCPTGTGDFFENFPPRTKARVNQLAVFEIAQNRSVVAEVFRLNPDRRLPLESQPGQIFQNSRSELRFAADRVDVFDPEQESPPELPGTFTGEPRGISVTGMKASRRAGSKSGGLHNRVSASKVRSPPLTMTRSQKVARFFQTAEDNIGKHAGFLISWVVVLWAIEVIDFILPLDLDQWLGLRPRNLSSLLPGLIFAPFLHGSFGHLASNTLSLVVLAWLVIISGWRQFWVTSVVVVLGSGLGTWLFGQANSVHIGASGLVFGYLGFLMSHGILQRSIVWILVAVGVGAVYGSMIWGVLPMEEGISWEGHLFGFLAGIFAAWAQREKSGSSSPIL